MPRGRGGRGGSGHNYQGSSHLYVPNSRREHPTTPATPWQSEKPVCRFFQRGHCSKGDKCAFPHPVDQKGVNTRTEAANLFVAAQKPIHGGLPHLGEAGDKHMTGIYPPVTWNAGDDVNMCDCNGEEARELAKLKESTSRDLANLRKHLAAAKHIIETLCEGDQTLTSRANAMAIQYKLEF